jgi:hypothetical protein
MLGPIVAIDLVAAKVAVPERDPVPAGRLLLDDPILGASTTERARKTVTSRLRGAIRHINTVIPELGATSPAP